MNFSIYDADTREVVVDMSYPADFDTGQKVAERNLLINEGGLNMNYSQQWFNGILLNFGDFTPGIDRRLMTRADTPVIEMRFALEGDTHIMLGRQQTSFSSGHHQVFYSGEQEAEFNRNGSATVFEVYLTEHYFKRLISDDCELMARLGDSIAEKEFAFLGQQLPITRAMSLIIADIRNNSHTNGLNRLYLESRILDLLMLQIEQLQQTLRPESLMRLKPHDIEKIHYAREILEKNISKPCSLIDLAHQAGINDFKLKQGFKEIYGNTVFGFLHEKRMFDAHRMLLDSGCNIEEVAFYCGFEHTRNFSAAFKKYWGITPTRLRN